MAVSNNLVESAKIKEAALALIALHKVKKGEGQGTEILFGDSPKVQLQFSIWKISGKKAKTHRIKLPHRPHPGSYDVCLFVRDMPKMDSEECQVHYKDKLRSKDITSVDEVITLKMLRTEYIPFEARRQLAKSYNMFLADDHIFRLLHTNLGKEFYKRNRYPVTVNLEKKDLKSEIDGAINSGYLNLTNRGSCSTVNIGHVGMTADELTENIAATIARLKQIVPGGVSNIKSIFVRSENSLSLPIYMSLEHAGMEEGGREEQLEDNDVDVRLDNSDIRKMRKQLRLEAEKELAEEEEDSDNEIKLSTKAAQKRRKETGGKSGKLTKKSKLDQKGVRKPTPKVGGKKKK